jgi:hypothetical protein
MSEEAARCAFSRAFSAGVRCRHVEATHNTDVFGKNHCAACHSTVIGTFCTHPFVPAPKEGGA